MPDVRRTVGKIKDFFTRLTRRRRSRNSHRATAGYQEGESERRSTPSKDVVGPGPSHSLPGPNPGDSARSIVHPSVANREDVGPVHSAAPAYFNVAQGSPHLHSAVIPPHPAMRPSASLLSSASTQSGLHDPTPPSPSPSLNARPNSNALQLPPQNARRPSPNTSLSNSPVHNPQPPPTTYNFFPDAREISIGQMNNNVQNYGSTRIVYDYLEPHISHGAAHNSGERSDAPKCDPETRQAVQEDIVSWMRHGDNDKDPKQIMWLGGPAGSGKTAIAGSVAETCRKEGLLAGTFFFSSFSGSEDRHSKRCVVSTLAHQFAGHPALHKYTLQLLAAIESQRDIFHKCLSDQAEHILMGPFREVKKQGDWLKGDWPNSIVLDGLDEVLAIKQPNWTSQDWEQAHQGDQLEILNVLLTLANDPAFPFRIFIASRPEQIITDFFATIAAATTLPLFLDSKYEPDKDIERFLWSKFAGIRRRKRIFNPLWPGQEAVNKMVEMSSGQFIVPAMIVRHIEAGVPQQQLDDILLVKWEDPSQENPFTILDALYTRIFRRSLKPVLAAKWIQTHNYAEVTIPALYLRRLVEDYEGEFHHVLEPLSSLVSIPMDGDRNTTLKIYHKTLSDFLSSQHRSGNLHLNYSGFRTFVADRCSIVLKNKGPAVPIHHNSDELGHFLDEFYLTTMGGGLIDRRSSSGRHTSFWGRVSESFQLTLPRMSQDAGNLLTTCNVSWWTRLCLTQSPCQTNYLGTGFISAMYCGIHRFICLSKSRSTLPTCHAACAHWRAGILAEAKALNWCVHKLEQADLGELPKFWDERFNARFKNMGQQEDGSILSCTICQP